MLRNKLFILGLIFCVGFSNCGEQESFDSESISELRSSRVPREEFSCEYYPCLECDPGDLDPLGVATSCPEDSGWLCCNDLSPVLDQCSPANFDGTCPGGYYWCDYYETNALGIAECWDEFGQG